MMGLFDEFDLDPPVECPECGKPHIHALQTKSLPDTGMRHFRVGDEITMDSYQGHLSFFVRDGWIEGYEWCKETDSMPYYRILIKDGRFDSVVYDWTWRRPDEREPAPEPGE